MERSVLSTIESHKRSGMASKEVLEHWLVDAGANAMAELANMATTAAEKAFMVS